MEIDLDRKANKIAKAQSQLKSRQGGEGAGGSGGVAEQEEKIH